MQANGTKLWLDEGAVHATKMLQNLITVEEVIKIINQFRN